MRTYLNFMSTLQFVFVYTEIILMTMSCPYSVCDFTFILFYYDIWTVTFLLLHILVKSMLVIVCVYCAIEYCFAEAYITMLSIYMEYDYMITAQFVPCGM